MFQTDMVLRNVRVSNSFAAKRALIVNAIGARVENTTVLSGPATNQASVEANNRNAVFDHVTVGHQGNSAAIRLNYQAYGVDGPYVFRDSVLQANANQGVITALNAREIVIERSRLSLGDPDNAVVSAPRNKLTIDSSLITGGDTGVSGQGTAGPLDISIRNSTIDASSPGSADPPGAGHSISTYSSLAANSVTVTADSSILLEDQRATRDGTGVTSITCTNSDAPVQNLAQTAVSGAIACGPEGSNSQSTVAQLFVNAPAEDWHLAPGSPARDTGAEGALAAGASVTDLDGNPRLLDSNNDCVARRDRGAYEHTTQQGVGTPGACNVTPPGPTGPSGPTGPTGPVPPPRDRTKPLVTRLSAVPRIFKQTSRGTKVTFRLSEKATAVLRLQRAVTGRKVGRSCLADTRARRRRAKCVRYVTVRTLTFAGKVGANERRIAPKSGRRTLAKGLYRVVAQATDAAKNRSVSRTVGLRVN